MLQTQRRRWSSRSIASRLRRWRSAWALSSAARSGEAVCSARCVSCRRWFSAAFSSSRMRRRRSSRWRCSPGAHPGKVRGGSGSGGGRGGRRVEVGEIAQGLAAHPFGAGAIVGVGDASVAVGAFPQRCPGARCAQHAETQEDGAGGEAGRKPDHAASIKEKGRPRPPSSFHRPLRGQLALTGCSRARIRAGGWSCACAALPRSSARCRHR